MTEPVGALGLDAPVTVGDVASLREHVGRAMVEPDVEWTADDCLLYAVGVGAGQGDQPDEIRFTTENSIGIELEVLPTMASLIGRTPVARAALGAAVTTSLVRSEESIRLHRPLSSRGTASLTSVFTGVHDVGSAALVHVEAVAVDRDRGDRLFTRRCTFFVRGAGGFGGPRPVRAEWTRPGRSPDFQVVQHTRPEQALLYRLCGDRNPLHSDPVIASKAGFAEPILHGLCTFGFAGRAVLHTACNSESGRLESIGASFAAPVFPGSSLHTSIWCSAGDVVFQTTDADGRVVLDRGVATLAEVSRR